MYSSRIHSPRRVHSRGGQTFSVNGQIANIFSRVDHTVSVATIHLCHCSTKASRDSNQMNLCFFFLILVKTGNRLDLQLSTCNIKTSRMDECIGQTLELDRKNLARVLSLQIMNIPVTEFHLIILVSVAPD